VFSDAAQHIDIKGIYPLHIACYTNQSETVVLKLIEMFPDAVQYKNREPIVDLVTSLISFVVS
jgi:hypothetical protein